MRWIHSLPMRNKWYLLLIAIHLGSCQNSPGPLPTPSPPPTPQVIRLGVSPAALPARAAVQSCAVGDASLGLVLVPAPSNLHDMQEFDLAIRLGDPVDEPAFAAALAFEEIVVVVNAQNPLDSLPANDLEGLYSGEAASWSQVGDEGEFRPELEVWHYPPGDELRGIFEAAVRPGQARQNPAVLLAPDPEAMRQAVGGSPGAVGYLPRAWLDETVRAVEIQPEPAGLSSLPILATARQRPQGPAFDLLVCLQSGAGQSVLAELYEESADAR